MFLTEGQNENNPQGKPDDLCSFLFIAFATWQQISKGGKESICESAGFETGILKYTYLWYSKSMHPTCSQITPPNYSLAYVPNEMNGTKTKSEPRLGDVQDRLRLFASDVTS